MANEITYSSQMKVVNGGLIDQYSVSGLRANQSAAFLVRNVQSVAAVWHAVTSALDLGTLVTPGWAMFLNLDAINYVQVGTNVGGVFVPFLTLKAGEVAGPVRLATVAPFALANTLAVKLFYVIYND